MKAVVYEKYGTPDVLQIRELDKPVPKPNEVLIKVRCLSLNASDKEFLTGNPSYVRAWGLLKPKYNILGSDVAGVVEKVGNEVTQFKVGDEVFGDVMYRWGGFAEYVCATEAQLIPKPSNRTFEEVATIPQSATVALQALRNMGKLKAGEHVLINGAGGGTGTFAIPLAKMMGAEVSAVDSTQKLEMMRGVGADHVIDYTKVDVTQGEKQYDLILDVVGYHSVFDYKRILKKEGRHVMCGGSLKLIFQMLFVGSLVNLLSKKKMRILAHKPNTKEDYAYILKLMEEGKIKAVIDQRYPLEETCTAMQYFCDGKALGKVIIEVP
ncbi:MAG: NAD(P)-dependent alcohol dehydrogenase [Cyclobacteriaceae bacterium]